MSKVINHETAGKERRHLVRLIALAIRELNSQKEITSETGDIAAFIALSLIAIHNSIDRTVEPWEKRGYWIKADRYRMEWAWTIQLANQMKDGLENEDWVKIAMSAVAIKQKMGNIKLPVRNNRGNFWTGALHQLTQK